MTNIEGFKNIKLDALIDFDDRSIKVKVEVNGDKDYSNFVGLNVPEDDVEFQSFAAIFIDLQSFTTANIICNYILTVALIKL